MSLIVSDRATDKQIVMLKKLEYYGDLNLSVEEAAQLIDEYFEEQRLAERGRIDDLEASRYEIY